MKILLILWLFTATAILVQPALAQSTRSAGTKTPAAAASAPQTVSGRITRLDTKSGVFSVRAGDNGQVVDLIARKDVVARLRRGERVTVTYQGKTATRIQMTRTGK